MDIEKYCKTLKLKKPYKIELVSKKHNKAVAHYWGMYKGGAKRGKLVSHLIRVYMGNLSDAGRDLDTIIAHELIHAWQEENGYTDTHGKSFKEMATKMSYMYCLPNIYMRGTDI